MGPSGQEVDVAGDVCGNSRGPQPLPDDRSCTVCITMHKVVGAGVDPRSGGRLRRPPSQSSSWA